MAKKYYAVYYRNSPFEEWTYNVVILDKKKLKKYIKTMKDINQAFNRVHTQIGVMHYKEHGDCHWTEPADHPLIKIQ